LLLIREVDEEWLLSEGPNHRSKLNIMQEQNLCLRELVLVSYVIII
jgi:hypothetical protein